MTPEEWFGGIPRVLFVHAHPDDECISTGGTIAALSECGREPLLVTMTRGERGEVRPGLFPHLQGGEGLAVHREQELAGALSVLGLRRHAFLGMPPARAEGGVPVCYEDSGMRWGVDGRAVSADDAGVGALTRASVADVIGDLLAAAYHGRAGAIVSYDGGGGYGHPDHVLAHRVSRSVAVALEVPFWEIVDSGASSGVGEGAPGVQRHDVSEWFDRKVHALRMYGTQLTVDGGEIVHVGGQRQLIASVEIFRRVDTSAPLAE